MANERQEGEKKERRILQRFVNFVIILIIVAHPTQITVGQAVKWLGFFQEETPRAEAGEAAQAPQAEAGDQAQPAERELADVGQEPNPSGVEQKIRKILSINFTFADLLIWLLLPLWLLKALIYGELRSIKLMPLPVFVLLGLCVVSVGVAQFHREATAIATITTQDKTYKGTFVRETDTEITILGEDGKETTIKKNEPGFSMDTAPVPERLWDVDRKSAIKETIQYAEFFAIAYLLFINNVTSLGLLRKVAYAFLLVSSFVILLGLAEYFHRTEIVEVTVEGRGSQEFKGKIVEESEDRLVLRTREGEKKIPKRFVTKREGAPLGIELPKFKLPGMKGPLLSFPVVRYPADIDSTFGFPSFMRAGAHEQVGTKSNRNVLSGYLCIVIPLMWGVALYHRGFLVRLWMLLGVVGGLLITLNGGAFIAILLAILVMSFIKSRKLFGGVIAVMFVMAILLSGAFRAQVSEEKVFRLPFVGETRVPDVVANCLSWKLPRENAGVLLDSLMLCKTKDKYGCLPEPFKGTDDLMGDLEERGYEGLPWQQRFMEWQPAMLRIMLSPVFGAGVGNYQRDMNRYYSESDTYWIDKPSVNLMEADALNYYLVLGVELGIPGILAFLWILLHFTRSSLESFSPTDKGLRNALALGALGSLLAFSITSVFTPMIIRGVAVTFVFVLALATTLKNLRAAPAGASGRSAPSEPPAAGPTEAANPRPAPSHSEPTRETEAEQVEPKKADDETFEVAKPGEGDELELHDDDQNEGKPSG